MNLKIFFKKTNAYIMAILFLSLSACVDKDKMPKTWNDAYEACASLKRGINLGNMFDGKPESSNTQTGWEEYSPTYPKIIADGGFDHVRLTVNWAAWASKDAPYTIDENFAKKIDSVIAECMKQGLAVIVDIHHYDEIMKEPAAHLERWLGILEQVAIRYKDMPRNFFLEPLNEPFDKLTYEIWNEYLQKAIAVVRKHDKERMLIIGPSFWNGIWRLEHFRLPPEDQKIIATIHYYEPMRFTHQGASWITIFGINKMKNVRWRGSEKDKNEIREHFDKILNWAKEHKRPLHIGEFGTYDKCPFEDRILWTKFVVELMNQHKIPYTYWSFGANFDAYDAEKGEWIKEIKDALFVSENSAEGN